MSAKEDIANEILNFNLDNVKNELNEMLDSEFQSEANDLRVGGAATGFASVGGLDYYQKCCDAQLRYIQQIKELQLGAERPTSMLATPPGIPLKSNVPNAANNVFNFNGRGGVSLSASPPPEFECHFLPKANIATEMDAAKVNQHGGGGHAHGGARKKQFQMKPKAQLPATNDFSLTNNKQDDVVRLFDLIRKLYHFLDNDKVPNAKSSADSSVNAKKIDNMPRTMNVQSQVKQASTKCANFLHKLHRVLEENKLYDCKEYLQCEESLLQLRYLLVQFDMFIPLVMEHRHGKFVTESARINAGNLERVIQDLTKQIRETHLNVHVFAWAMERNRKDMALMQQQEVQRQIKVQEQQYNLYEMQQKQQQQQMVAIQQQQILEQQIKMFEQQQLYEQDLFFIQQQQLLEQQLQQAATAINNDDFDPAEGAVGGFHAAVGNDGNRYQNNDNNGGDGAGGYAHDNLPAQNRRRSTNFVRFHG